MFRHLLLLGVINFENVEDVNKKSKNLEMNTWLQPERIYQPLATTFGLCGPLDLSPSEAVIGTAILSISTRKIDIKYLILRLLIVISRIVF